MCYYLHSLSEMTVTHTLQWASRRWTGHMQSFPICLTYDTVLVAWEYTRMLIWCLARCLCLFCWKTSWGDHSRKQMTSMLVVNKNFLRNDQILLTSKLLLTNATKLLVSKTFLRNVNITINKLYSIFYRLILNSHQNFCKRC